MQTISSALETALDTNGANEPKGRVIMTLSNNAHNEPALGGSSHRFIDVIADTQDIPSMKILFTDMGMTLDSGYRLYPNTNDADFNIPWIGNKITNSNGILDSPEIVEVIYSQNVTSNKITIVSDPFGINDSGRISLMDVYIYKDNNWTLVAENYDPGSYFGALYLQNSSGLNWTTEVNREFTTTFRGIKIEVKRISIDDSQALTKRNRRTLLYEIDAQLEVDISEDIMNLSVNKTRDLSATNFSPLGHSVASTMSLTLANHDNKYNNEHDDCPYKGMLSVNSKFNVEVGFKVGSEYEYIQQGIFLVDSWDMDSTTTVVSISARDYSKLLQERIVHPRAYINMTITEVLQDALELAGFKDYEIDESTLTLQDLVNSHSTSQLSNASTISTNLSSEKIVWSEENMTYWDFLLNLSLSDLGVFFFDEHGKFIYHNKERVSSADITSQKNLTDNDYIISAGRRLELMKNDISMSYTVPKRTGNTVGLWEAPDPTVLGVTQLAGPVDRLGTSFPATNIEDWPKEGFFRIGNEIVEYKSRTNTSFDECERGVLNTMPEGHYSFTSLFVDNSVANWSNQPFKDLGMSLTVNSLSDKWAYIVTRNPIITTPNEYIIEGRIEPEGYSEPAIIFNSSNDFKNFYKISIKTTHDFRRLNKGKNKPNEEFYAHIIYNVTLSSVIDEVESVLYTAHHDVDITANPKNDYRNNKFKLQLEGNRIKFYLNDILLINTTDSSVAKFGGIGFGVKGTHKQSSTRFSSVIVKTRIGSKLYYIFGTNYPSTIYEVRKLTASFSEAPALNSQYWLTNDELASVIHYESSPFGATIYVLNLFNGLTVIEGSPPDEAISGLKEFLIVVGEAVELDIQREVNKKDKKSIKKFGKSQFSATLPWVQSETHAKALTDYLVNVYKNPVSFIDSEIMALPHLQLGDVVNISYPRLGDDADYHITESNITLSEGAGYNQSIVARKSVKTTNSTSVGAESCRIASVPDSFFNANTTSFTNHSMPYLYYKKNRYDKDATPVVATDGLTIPITTWRPVNIDGTDPEPLGAIIVPASKFPGGNNIINPFDDEKETIEPYLVRLAKTGYVVCFVRYRGMNGYGPDHRDAEDLLHDDLGDLKATSDWLQTQTFVDSNKMFILGEDRAASMAYYSSVAYPGDYTGFICSGGTPNIGCTLQKWPDSPELRDIQNRYYTAFGGSPLENPNEYLNTSPSNNISTIVDDFLILSAQNDTIYDIREIYEFYEKMFAADKNIESLSYIDKGGRLLYLSDENFSVSHELFNFDSENKTKYPLATQHNESAKFTSEPWLRIVEWLDSYV